MNNNTMREIKFRGKQIDTLEWIYGYLTKTPEGLCKIHFQPFAECSSNTYFFVFPESVGQYAGLNDKNGKEVYEGDEIRYRVPYRTTQTHTGDNIPNGSYTEPMEPGIKTHEGIVVFEDACFQFKDYEKDGLLPLAYVINEWDLEQIKDSISYGRPGRFIFDDPEEGDLQYLLTDCAKVETAEKLIEYLNGVEIIGNIYENPVA